VINLHPFIPTLGCPHSVRTMSVFCDRNIKKFTKIYAFYTYLLGLNIIVLSPIHQPKTPMKRKIFIGYTYSLKFDRVRMLSYRAGNLDKHFKE